MATLVLYHGLDGPRETVTDTRLFRHYSFASFLSESGGCTRRSAGVRPVGMAVGLAVGLRTVGDVVGGVVGSELVGDTVGDNAETDNAPSRRGAPPNVTHAHCL